MHNRIDAKVYVDSKIKLKTDSIKTERGSTSGCHISAVRLTEAFVFRSGDSSPHLESSPDEHNTLEKHDELQHTVAVLPHIEHLIGDMDNRAASANQERSSLSSRRCGPLSKLFVTASLMTVLSLSLSHFGWQKITTEARLAMSSGNLSKAERLLQLAGYESQKMGIKDRRYAASIHNLGELYLRRDAFEQAEPLLVEAVRLRSQLLGDSRLELADSLMCVGNVYEKTRRLKDAENCYSRAGTIRASMYGHNHPLVGEALQRIGWCKLRSNDGHAAVPLFEHALQIELKTGSPRTERVRELLEDLVRTDQPERYRTWLAILESSNEHWEPEAARMLVWLARSERDIVQGEKYFTEAINTWGKFFARKPTSSELRNYSRACFTELADRWCHECPPNESQHTLTVPFGEVYRVLFRHEQSVKILKRELALLGNFRDENLDPALASVLGDLGRCVTLPKAEREGYCRQAVSIWRDVATRGSRFWRSNAIVDSSIDYYVDDVFETLVELREGKDANAIRNQELQMWESTLGRDALKVSGILPRVAAGQSVTEQRLLLDRSLGIFEKHLLDAKNAGHADEIPKLLWQAERVLNSWKAVRGLDVGYICQRELRLVEKFAGHADWRTAEALTSLAESPHLTLTLREQATVRAIEIWRHYLATHELSSDYIGVRPSVYKLARMWWLAMKAHPKSVDWGAKRIDFWEFAQRRCIKTTDDRVAAVVGTQLAGALSDQAMLETLPKAKRISFLSRAVDWYEHLATTPHWISCNPIESTRTFEKLATLAPENAVQIYRRELKIKEKLGDDGITNAPILLNLARTSTDEGEVKTAIVNASRLLLSDTVGSPFTDSELRKRLPEALTLLNKYPGGSKLALSMARQAFTSLEGCRWIKDKERARALTRLGGVRLLPAHGRHEFLERSASIWERQKTLTVDELRSALTTFSRLAVLDKSCETPSSATWMRALALCDKYSGKSGAWRAALQTRLAASLQQEAVALNSCLPAIRPTDRD